MDEPPFLEPREREAPRWAQIVLGVILALFTLFCALASLSLLFVRNDKAPVLAKVVGGVLLLGCFWVFGKCFRLVTGRKIQGALLGPSALRVVAYLLLLFPVIGLFTGYYRENGPTAIFQAVMYLFGFFGLRALARKREAVREDKTDVESTR